MGGNANQHLKRTIPMAVAYQKSDHAFYKNPALKKAVMYALTFWVNKDVQASNTFFHGHEYQNVDLFDFGSDEWLYENIFCLYQDHGVQPTDEHYQYIVVPSVTENELRQYVKTSHIQIKSNTETLQAVCHDQLGVSGIVFYQPGHVQLTENIKVSVDQPCIVVIREMGQTIQVALSNPENTEADITLQINTHELHFFIPSGQYAGQSIIQTVTL